MNCNREEAVRARGRAEEQMQRGDFSGARNFVLKAMHLFPDLDNLLQILTVCNVHCSSLLHSESPFPDWYGVLGVDRAADKAVFRKQYHKLALLLHPDKNKFPGAEAAFKLVGEANLLLSDPVRRMIYDSSAFPRIRGGPHSPPPFHGGVDMASTFVTRCPFCNFTSRNHRCFTNVVLRCHSCSKPFIALDILAQPPPPPTFSPDPPYAFPAPETAGPHLQTSPDTRRHHHPTVPPPVYRDAGPAWRRSVNKSAPSGSKRKRPCGRDDVSSVGKLPAVRNPAQSESKRRRHGGKDDVAPVEKSPAVEYPAQSRSNENGENKDVSTVRNPPAVENTAPSGGERDDICPISCRKDDVTPFVNPSVVEGPPMSSSGSDGREKYDISSTANRPAVEKVPSSDENNEIGIVENAPAVRKLPRSGSEGAEKDDIISVENLPAVKKPSLSELENGEKDDISPVGKSPEVEKPPADAEEDDISTVEKPPAEPEHGEDDISTVEKPPPQPEHGEEDDICTVEKPPVDLEYVEEDDIRTVEKPPAEPEYVEEDDIRTVEKPPAEPEHGEEDDISTVEKPPPEPDHGEEDDISSVENPPAVEKSPAVIRPMENGKKDDITPLAKPPPVKESDETVPFGNRLAVEKPQPSSPSDEDGGADDVSPERRPDREGPRDQHGEKTRGDHPYRADDNVRERHPETTPENLISKPVQTVFHDFSTGRTEDKFKAGQVWAVLHGPERRPPLRYVQVERVEPSGAGFRVRVVELMMGVGPTSCFILFRAGPTLRTELLDGADFSHPTEAVPAGEGRYDVQPRKGEVWAFREGDQQAWRVVEVRDCVRGRPKVKRLRRVRPGRSVFKERKLGMGLVTVHEKDMWRFSHRIPAFRLDLKVESLGRCWELDPATLPDCD